MIAVGGGYGTLAEIAYARILGRPVVVLEPGWDLGREGVERASTPEEAVELALRLASGGRLTPGRSAHFWLTFVTHGLGFPD